MALRFVVGEISKSWRAAEPVNGDTRTLSQLFELMTAYHDQRGYRLHSFQIHQVMTDAETLSETLIAVFERTGEEVHHVLETPAVVDPAAADQRM